MHPLQLARLDCVLCEPVQVLAQNLALAEIVVRFTRGVLLHNVS